jgi:endonuclease G
VVATTRDLEALAAPEFSWPGTLLLARASKLAYETRSAVSSVVRDQWGFDTFEFIDTGDTQGFMAAAANVAMVAFRGTESLGDWLANLSVTRSAWPPFGSVHTGFLGAFALVREQVKAFVVQQQAAHLWVTGHSLGGALATIAAAELSAVATVSGVCTFGQPRLSDTQVENFFATALRGRFHRFVNNNDIVSRVPPGFHHVGRLIHFDATGDVTEAEAATETAGVEPPPLSKEQFEGLQAEIRSTKAALARAGVEEAVDGTLHSPLDASIEGLIPSLSDHRMDRYVAAVARQIAPTSIESVEVHEPTHESAGGIESPRRRGKTPVLIRLRNSKSTWSPPSGVEIKSQVGSIVSARVTAEAVDVLRSDSQVVSLETSRDAGQPELATVVPYVQGDTIHRPPISERGDKALIGVIDTGIDVLHQAFRDAVGRTRILAVWDQKATAGQSPSTYDPVRFRGLDAGALYLSADIEAFIARGVAPANLRDPQGHGTHVAGIAAGRAVNADRGGPGDGMAPDAGLVVVIPDMRMSLGEAPSIGYSASHVEALEFLRKVREGGIGPAEPLPMVVNVSLGMNAGAHNGRSKLESAFDGFTNIGHDPGIVIVKSAGNERGYHGHVRFQAALGVTMSAAWTSTGEARNLDYIEVWYDNWDDLEFELIGPSPGSALPGDPLPASPIVSKRATEANVVLGNADCNLRLTASTVDGPSRLAIAIAHRGGRPVAGTWQLDVRARDIKSRDAWIDAWVERDFSRAVSFGDSDNSMTLSIPGTAQSVITVGACRISGPQPRLMDTSAWGLTLDGRPKPDICAPGEAIRSAQALTIDGAVAMDGTSMAAAMVSGTLALVLSQRHKSGQPQWNARQLHNGLLRQSRGFTGVHNKGSGYGVLDALAAFNHFAAGQSDIV